MLLPLVKGGVGKKEFLLGLEAAGCLHGGSEDRMDPVLAEECLPSHCIRNENELQRPFGKGEVSKRHVRLSVGRYEAHVSRWDADEGGHVAVASNRGVVPRRVIPNL